MTDEVEGLPPPKLVRARIPFVGDDLIDVACVAIAAALAVAVATGERSAIRTVTAVIFAAFVPGRAIVSNWPSMAARSQIAVCVLFSLTVLTLFATVTLWMGQWHPLPLLEVECVAAIAGLIVALLRRRRIVPARGPYTMKPDQSE